MFGKKPKWVCWIPRTAIARTWDHRRRQLRWASVCKENLFSIWEKFVLWGNRLHGSSVQVIPYYQNESHIMGAIHESVRFTWQKKLLLLKTRIVSGNVSHNGVWMDQRDEDSCPLHEKLNYKWDLVMQQETCGREAKYKLNCLKIEFLTRFANTRINCFNDKTCSECWVY